MAALHLTFDDGPDRAGTPEVLEALAGAGARATFFVMAAAARDRAALIGTMLEGGHAVELHAWRHRRHLELDRVEIERDAVRGLRALASLGVSPARWRTPWGEVAAATQEVAERLGLALTGWTADTQDWRGGRAEAMTGCLAPGAVVLAHDGLGPGARRTDVGETVRFVGLAAAWAHEHGVALEALPVPGQEPPGLRIPPGRPPEPSLLPASAPLRFDAGAPSVERRRP